MSMSALGPEGDLQHAGGSGTTRTGIRMPAARETDQRVPSSDVEIWCPGKDRITTAVRD